MRNNRGQGVLMTVLLLGILMAIIIVFGAKRQADVAVLVTRLDASQTAYEVLALATKRVQTIYANESSCDPNILDNRISRLDSLPAPASISTLNYGTTVSYAVAQTRTSGAQLSAVERSNICTGSTLGCRQLAINLENLVYVVTVGNIVSDAPVGTRDCPRDAVFRVSVAINGNVYSQWSTLINVCTLTSCVGDSFTGMSVTVPGGSTSTAACGTLPVRYYGSMTQGTAAAQSSLINTDDVRWARRYLDSGGGAIGETTYLVDTRASTDITNGSCPATTTGPCFGRNCIPAFDLNLDKTNNESDLGILELYLRGYLLSLPVSELK